MGQTQRVHHSGFIPPGPPVCDDLVERDFSASGINELWLTDIVRHEALLNRVEVRDHHRLAVAAAR